MWVAGEKEGPGTHHGLAAEAKKLLARAEVQGEEVDRRLREREVLPGGDVCDASSLGPHALHRLEHPRIHAPGGSQ